MNLLQATKYNYKLDMWLLVKKSGPKVFDSWFREKVAHLRS